MNSACEAWSEGSSFRIMRRDSVESLSPTADYEHLDIPSIDDNEPLIDVVQKLNR